MACLSMKSLFYKFRDMKKANYIIGIIFVLLCTFISCKTPEQKYLDDYAHFAESFLANYDNYTATDWETATHTYAQYRESYAVYMSDLSVQQRQQIDQYNSKINAIIIRHAAEDATNQIESIFNEAIGTLNELLK